MTDTTECDNCGKQRYTFERCADGADGFRTERYAWDWFSDDGLATLLTAENPLAELERGHE